MNSDISSFSMLELHLLWELHQHPNHGYGLLKVLNQHAQHRMTPGTLYPILKKFNQLELIQLKETVKVGEKTRKVYGITPLGEKTLERASNEFVSTFRGMLDFFHCNSCFIPTDVRKEWKQKELIQLVKNQQ